jgi:hypothetical protein
MDRYDNPFAHYRKPEQSVTRNEFNDLLARVAALEVAQEEKKRGPKPKAAQDGE